MKGEKIFNVKSRPPRHVNPEEFHMGVNPFKHLNIGKPLMTTLAPVVTSVLTGVLRGECNFGKPVRIRDVMVTMRDGVKTALDVYFPKKVYAKRLKCPTILIRTPYWKDELGL